MSTPSQIKKFGDLNKHAGKPESGVAVFIDGEDDFVGFGLLLRRDDSFEVRVHTAPS